MTKIVVLGMTMLLGGCMVVDREALYYTRSDVDAVNAGIQCRQLAKTLVQVARCDVRR